jgi:hypothetical protein
MKPFALLGASLVALACVSGAFAQQPGAPQTAADALPSVVMADTVTATAKITDLDRAGRKVTMRDERGDERSMIAGPEIKNFDQIEIGDTVTAEYIVEIGVYVRAAGEPPSGAAVTSVEVAPKGQKPTATMVQQTEITATIDEIDYAKRSVVLRNAEGKTRLIQVNERVQNLEQFKKGDEIAIRHTEALAISVRK